MCPSLFPSPNEIALQLHPEHRLFVQAFVATHGDRGKSIVATGRPCPPRAIYSRSEAILARQDVQRYLYSLLISDADALHDFRGDPDWCQYIERVLDFCGNNGGFAVSSPSDSSGSEGLIPAAAARGCPDISVSEDVVVGDTYAVQQFWLKSIKNGYLPFSQRLKASELYARSLGMFDPNRNSSSLPVFEVTPIPSADEDDVSSDSSSSSSGSGSGSSSDSSSCSEREV